MSPTSVQEIDLSPLPEMNYFDTEREWREEFIYFLMVDRFHDDHPRTPTLQAARTSGIQAQDNLFYGGKIKGITQNLDYIAGLGCTAIWLSPVFENNANAYHGYNIYNYLNIDPNFGTKQDLIDLVQAAHNYQKNGVLSPIRIILDVVINHSGDNWDYDRTIPGFQDDFSDDRPRQFGQWRRNPGVIPTELANRDYYHRRGNIRDNGGWDSYPENQHGDIYGLKDYANDDDQNGSDVINILIKAHCYWIRETDIDGFRVDAIKHMGELACSRFCSNVREYAYSLGKRHFFLFGELATPNDGVIDRYIGPNTSVQDGNTTVFFGINSVLDFRLAEGIWGDDNNHPLRDVITGKTGLTTLINRFDAQRERALNRGELGRYLVTFVDNHDAFWQTGRIGSLGNDDQVIAAIGFLLCSLGTACIYYGTEQGFSGSGSDNAIREAMFDKATPDKNLLNTDATIYQKISQIAHVARITPALRYGRIYLRQTSTDNGTNFSFPSSTDYTLAFSRILYPSEVLVAYNVSNHQRQDCIIVDASLHQAAMNMSFLYGGSGTVPIQAAFDGEGKPTGAYYVQLPLEAHQFVILT